MYNQQPKIDTMQQKVVIIGSAGTGKTSILDELIYRGYFCMPEISRKVTIMAQKEGIEQLFLTDPLLFSNLLLEGREKQFLDADKNDDKFVFFDRGIPDIYAYLDFLKIDYPEYFISKSKHYLYHKIFMLPPWKEIYVSDNERYESFKRSVEIHHHLEKTYKEIGYKINIVPFGSVKERTNFILDSLKNEIQ